MGASLLIKYKEGRWDSPFHLVTNGNIKEPRDVGAIPTPATISTRYNICQGSSVG